MDFFKSVFVDEPSSPKPSISDHDEAERNQHYQNDDDSNHNNKAWSFGGLIKTLATKSESVIQNYRRDFEEFGSELKKETAVIRDVASRAVKDLPNSLEVGATVASESLESVGQAIDDIGNTVWKSTAEIITHGRDALLVVDDVVVDDSDYALENSQGRNYNNLKPYSRFEAQVRAIQSNLNTYLEEPQDLENYEQWKLGFSLGEKSEEIENLIKENEELGEIYRNFVPDKIDNDSFWLRYFYRLHKLKEIEDARLKLVNRVISGGGEDLSWDFGDDEDEDEDDEKGNLSVEVADKIKDNSTTSSTSLRGNGDKSEEKVVVLVSKSKTSDNGSESSKDSDVSIVSKPEEEEEDIGWDEIEDIGNNDEIKATDSVGSSSKADLHKRLSNAVEEDEDLSWDIEDDDDEPSKS